MTCESAHPLITAYVDGELDVVNALEIEKHLAACPSCARLRQSQQDLGAALRGADLYHTAPASLRRRVRRPAPKPWFNFAMLAAAAAALVFAVGLWITRPSRDQLLAQEVVSAHVRSLMAAHLTDVASTDRHTVKPWFAGKLDFSPGVSDLAAQGFPLSGGRLDYVQGHTAAALVYQRNKHVINLFIWPSSADEAERTSTVNGYHLIHWSNGGMAHWVISDLNETELHQFRDLLRE